MKEKLDKAKDWIGERGVPFEPQLARMSDKLDEAKERRDQKKTEKDGEGSGEDEQEEESSAQSESSA